MLYMMIVRRLLDGIENGWFFVVAEKPRLAKLWQN